MNVLNLDRLIEVFFLSIGCSTAQLILFESFDIMLYFSDLE